MGVKGTREWWLACALWREEGFHVGQGSKSGRVIGGSWWAVLERNGEEGLKRPVSTILPVKFPVKGERGFGGASPLS